MKPMTPKERATKDSTCGLPDCSKRTVRHYWWECPEGREKEIHAAVEATEEEDIKAVCLLCAAENAPRREVSGDWFHKWEQCNASAIHERRRQRRGK